MSSPGSITELIQRVKRGDETAARQLCERYVAQLQAVARNRLPHAGLGIADDEDVVLNALASFFVGVARGQFPNLEDREDLWHLLVTLTTRKALRLLESENAQKRDRSRKQPNQNDSHQEQDLRECADPRPAPDIQALQEEACQQLLERLADAQLQAIAVWKLEGYTNEEVAAMLGCTLRSVERKLGLIRRIWSQEQGP